MTLPELFKNYLKTQKISSVTIKNYVADINNFFNWLESKTQIKHQVAGISILCLFTKETIEEYKKEQTFKNIPLSTINRHLSALRRFGSFVQSQGWINKNPALQISNPESPAIKEDNQEEILKRFKEDLREEQITAVTIKNYLSDLKHFLGWLKEA